MERHTYTVTIRRVIYTEIAVEARSVKEARGIVKDYGADLAVSDFPHRDFPPRVSIVTVRKAR